MCLTLEPLPDRSFDYLSAVSCLNPLSPVYGASITGSLSFFTASKILPAFLRGLEPTAAESVDPRRGRSSFEPRARTTRLGHAKRTGDRDNCEHMLPSLVMD